MSQSKDRQHFDSQTTFVKSSRSIQNHNGSSYYNHNSMVFVNPKRLNTTVLNTGNGTNQDLYPKNKGAVSKSTSRVYINPNFKKHHVPSTQSETNISLKNIIKYKTESVSKQVNCRKYLSSSRSLLIKDHPSRVVSKQFDQDCDLKKNHKIFINPNYTISSKPNTNISPRSSTEVSKSVKIEKFQNLQFKNGSCSKPAVDASLVAQVKYSSLQEVQRINLCKKKQLPLNKKELTLKRRKKSDDVIKPINTIFINPKFEGGLQNLNGICTAKQTESHLNFVSQNIPVHISDGAIVSRGIQKESSSQSCSSTSVVGFPSSCLTGPHPIKKANTTKQVSQRNRTCSSSLVAISTTKLIRKRKLSQSVESKVKPSLNQPIFVSKTKLVRSPPNKGLNNKLIGKTKVKRILPRFQLQLLTPDKIMKLRKQSFTNSLSNLVDVVPNSSPVTKIKSKNGKSLRLVRKNIESHKSKSELSTKTLYSIQNKKSPLKQQIRRDALCLVNKLRKTQFSKINLRQVKKNIHQSGNESKYVYKNRYSTLRLSQTKCLVNTIKQYQTAYKLKNYNHHTEKNKIIKSKYSVIRKQSCKTTNKSDSCKRNIKKINPVIRNSSRQKHKVQNSVLKTSHTRKKLSIVNIGGVFYRCSRTSLTRNRSPSKVLQTQSKGLLLNIRGQKFQLENNGQTLKCLDNKPGRKRIDIGGVTFITSSSGSSLTRTNYHTARSIIVQAKQKSLSQLTRKHKKNNEPCPFFHRLGRCAGQDRGSCVRLHDPKYIAVCKKFIQGLCEGPMCLLSHKFSCHNMPTCQHFLAGHCGRDLCPYPHIKVSDNAPICLDFLRGFCSLGDQCTKRHLAICPSFEKGLCSRGKYCPYPHPKSKSDLQLKGKFKHLEKKPQSPRDPNPVSSCNLRYFEDVNLQNENKMILHEDLEKPEECDSEVEDQTCPLKKRPKLGRLPSFIPLSLDSSCNDL